MKKPATSPTTHTHFKWFIFSVGLLLAQCLFLYGSTARDDAFFTYWSAYSLAHNGHVLNYNGDAIEQSSTLLHTLLLATINKIFPFVSIPTLSWILSWLAGVLALLAFVSILKNKKTNPLPIIVLASSSSFVFWSNSGMETLSSTALFTAILWFCLQPKLTTKQLSYLALCCIAAVLNRPESFIVLLFFVIAAWFLQCLLQLSVRKTHHIAWLTALLATALSAVAITAWRYFYFGDWLPQPVTAKNSDNIILNIFKGIQYLLNGGHSITTQAITASGIACTILALLYWKHPHRIAVISCFLLSLAQMAFIIATGGDWMDASRFLLPVLPALLLCSVLFFARWPMLLGVLTISMAAVALQDSWQFARTQSTGFALHERNTALTRYLSQTPSAKDHYSLAELQTKDALRDIPQLEHTKTLINKLNRYPQKINIASIQMGFIPYHLSIQFPNRLHFLDLRALSTRNLTDCTLLKSFKRTEKGIDISYDQFFALLPVLQRQCGIQKPDILYDLGYDMRQPVLQDNGYIITYREVRSVRGDFSTRAIGSTLFVAIRKELAAQYGIADINGHIPTLPPAQTNNRPNIVLVIADDVSYDKFGFMGSPAAKTPTLDQLAQQGTVFTTAYVPTAFCRPSLATLLTGQWPHQNKIYANNGVIALPPGSKTLATQLQQHGYMTFSGGKFWEDEPDLRGFDRYDNRHEQFARIDQNKLWQFLDEFAGKQPMFIWWAPMIPHLPHNPPQPFLDAIDENAIYVQPSMPADKQPEFRKEEKKLLAMNSWFDAEFYKLYKNLSDRKLLDNTLFIFMADNGFSYRGASKSTPYELGLRTPIVFNWKNHIPTQRITAETNTVNLYDTILDFAGIPLQPGPKKTGHSLRPVVEQRATPIPEKLFGADYPAFTLKTDPLPRPERDIFALHVRDENWKYIFYIRDVREKDNYDLTIKPGVKPFPERSAGDEELFYLPNDPYEETNLANQVEQKNRIEQYRREVLHWWYNTGGKTFDAAQHCPERPVALCQKLIGMPTQ